ncbi:MAG: NAD(P)/FAD-dependent oxidoreductase [Eubacterium sp.]
MKFLKVSNIKVNIEDDENKAFLLARKAAGVSDKEIKNKKIIKLSIDARNKNEIHKIYTVGLYLNEYLKKRKNVTVYDKEPEYNFKSTGTLSLNHRPVIVGFGPAGMFCGYMLAQFGYKPIIIERGSRVEERTEKINRFWKEGKLDTECNVQFGEGGAGTFSDGKLNTQIKDREHRIHLVLETFVKFGAKENILYDAKPHIGTDVLSKVVKNIREYIGQKGGTFLFDTALVSIEYDNNKLKRLQLSDGTYIDTDLCILAIGHSARDTFEMLHKKNVSMEQKPFAVGVRVEHQQKEINKSQYGFDDNRLGAASYKLTYKTQKGRGVYSFCMCPGGYVVNASSEKEHLVVNGMSYNARAGINANSAIVVTVTPADFNSDHPLAGVNFQRNLENRAFIEGNGKIPIQKLKDFKELKASVNIGAIEPSSKGATSFSDINKILPEFICDSIKEGMEHFGKIIEGFDRDDVILSAVESRTSSPVRIIRNENFQSNISGLFPAGEGAGYAGGITSAAIDGIKIFEYIAKNYKPF